MKDGFRVFTLNVSAGNTSAWAPPGFTVADKYRKVVELIGSCAPHLISLQELDSAAAAVIGDGLAEQGYQHLGSAESHCHSTHIWAASRLNAVQCRPAGPAAIAQVPLPLPDEGGPDVGGSQGCLYFAGCHLEPFAEGAAARRQQIETLLRHVPPYCRFVLAGDTNMRKAENAGVEALGLEDAFESAGRPLKHQFTWNSTINRYHGLEQRGYTARYDRIYLRGCGCQELAMVAAEPVTPGRHDYLSDHFGLLATLRLLPGQQRAVGRAGVAPRGAVQPGRMLPGRGQQTAPRPPLVP